jgi:hypothetical protein
MNRAHPIALRALGATFLNRKKLATGLAHTCRPC